MPITKGQSSILHEPLSHRGQAMQSCIYKLYSLLLNDRLYSYVEGGEFLHDVQNGFRKTRNCADHIFTLSESIKLNLGTPESRVYACFVDVKKAFPSVDRGLLLWKLKKIGVSGRIYAAVRASFLSPTCRLKLPMGNTDYFENLHGTLEGSPNSPLNFGLYINDLLEDLSNSGLGIYYASGLLDKIVVLAYADDLVLVASNEHDLQLELDILYGFCRKWRLNVNVTKTKAMVFRRNPRCRMTKVNVKYGSHDIEQVASYKYLGITLDEMLSFALSYMELGASSSCALGSLINKCKTHKNMGLKTFDRLVEGGVFSIIDYGAEVTGFDSHRALDDVYNRASRYFIGLNKFCPLPCLSLEMGWLPNRRRRNLCVLRYYNQIHKMEDSRLPKKIYLATKNNNGSWANRVQTLLNEILLGHYWDTDSGIPMDIIKMMIREKSKEELFAAIDERPKLRTYPEFVVGLQPSSHIRCHLPRQYRSVISQLRCGILHLRIETGRFVHEKVQERICLLCDLGCVESEQHFVFECPFYSCERTEFMTALGVALPGCHFSDVFKHPYALGKYLTKIWQKRSTALSN